MAIIKRTLAVLFCLMILTLAACKDNNGNSSTPSADVPAVPTVPEALSVFYNAKDSLNPYAVTSEHNHKLQTLLFDPLVKLSTAFQPEYIVADTIMLDSKQCTVSLKNVSFSDGSALTADDVIYSVKLAKNSALSYAEQLNNIKSVKAIDSKTVSFELGTADPYFVNILTFPIIKAESEKRTDENKIVLEPIGSGRFVYKRDSKILVANESYIFGASPIKQITLIDAPDSEIVNFNLESNNVDIYTSDLNDGKLPSMNGAVQLSPLNNLLYLGLNLNSTWLKAPEMRYALSYAIDRTAVADKAYYSYALPATGLFSPLWGDAGGVQNLNTTANLENSIANLKELGYNNKDKDGFYTNSGGKAITLSLICNKENERKVNAANLIKSQLESAGVKVNLRTLSWDDYMKAIAGGNYDLYIAEIKLSNNMDVRELVTSTGSLSYGIPDITASPKKESSGTASKQKGSSSNTSAGDDSTVKGTGASQSSGTEGTEEYIINQSLDNAVNAFYKGEASLVDIVNAFNAEMPIIPICYRSGITVIGSQIANENMSSLTDAYYNITNTKAK